jgi:hypothetical protein
MSSWSRSKKTQLQLRFITRMTSNISYFQNSPCPRDRLTALAYWILDESARAVANPVAGGILPTVGVKRRPQGL